MTGGKITADEGKALDEAAVRGDDRADEAGL